MTGAALQQTDSVTTHVVALSGGKDSTAMALRLAEVDPDVGRIYVCTPTGNELPEMFAHWLRIGELLGSRVVPIVASSLDDRIAHHNALPNWRQRWCTRELKIEPFAAYLTAHAPTVSYVGLRADEEGRGGVDYSAFVPSTTTRFPLREWGWGLADVLGYLDQRGVTVPERTDCAVCFFQRLGQWYDLWRDHPDQWAEGERWEAATGHTFRSPGRDSWPAPMAKLRGEFERGRIPKDRIPGRALPQAMFDTGPKHCRACSL